jgi:4-amino-4-deoxy-L-arabinose transferase-like glycosyltransferase
MSIRIKIALIMLVLVAAALRIQGLFSEDLHPDEALFATWARLIAVWRDPLLRNQLVDKPPLLYYLQSLFYPLMGPESLAARLPNYIASMILIPLTALLGWRLYKDNKTTVFAAAIIVFSPLAVQFSSSAFIDPLMTVLISASLVATAGTFNNTSSEAQSIKQDRVSTITTYQVDHYARRLNSTYVAGFLFGLAVATKYQALLFLPLTIGIGLLRGWRRRQWKQWTIGLIPVLMAVVVWDIAQDNKLSLIGAQWDAFGGLRIARSWELWPRLAEWANQWLFLLGSSLLGFLIILGLPVLLRPKKKYDDVRRSLDQLMTLFLLGYFLLHWIVAIPVWDRYVLAALPIASIVLARLITILVDYLSAITEFRSTRRRSTEYSILAIVVILLLALQAPLVESARKGELAVNSAIGPSRGISEQAELLQNLPDGTVLYDHWYSWQWRYYLFDEQIYVSWFPDVDTLIRDINTFGRNGDPRYISLPNDSRSGPVIRAVQEAGFGLKEMSFLNKLNESDTVLYQLIPPG